jgi:hypothetical protein
MSPFGLSLPGIKTRCFVLTGFLFFGLPESSDASILSDPHANCVGSGRLQGAFRFFGTAIGGTWNASASAIAPASADSDAKSGGKPAGGSVGTRVVSASGGGATASAAGDLLFKIPTVAPFTLLVSPRGSFCSVDDPSGVGASASWIANDPAIFDRGPGPVDQFDGVFDLESGFGLNASGDPATSALFFTMGSNDPGYEFLFSLRVGMTGSGLGSLSTAFVSNPLLGLSDTTITNTIQSALISGNGFLQSDLTNLVQFTLPDIPEGQEVILTPHWEGSASTAPEPATILPVMVVLVGLIGIFMRKASSV